MDAEVLTVAAVVVTYQPDLARLGQQLAVLAPQVDHVVIIDNASRHRRDVQLLAKRNSAQAVLLDENHGIGAAQNRGIQLARESGVDCVLLMDQDSLPHSDMVVELKEVLASAPDAAGVGPLYQDPRREAVSPFVRLDGFRIRRMPCPEKAAAVAVDFLISSGSLIRLEAFERVGLLREDLFIDYVDTEWCMRARAHGYSLLGVSGARMEHALGESPIRAGAHVLARHAPVRKYYQMRNSLLLSREAFIPWQFRFAEVLRALVRSAGCVILARPRAEYARMVMRGVWDGARGRGGRHASSR